MGLEPVGTSGNTAVAGILAASVARSKNLAGLRPWQPGTSGNPSGRPKSAKFRRELIKQLRQEIVPGVTRLAQVCDRAIETAAADDVAAMTFVRDTVDGKPTASDDRPSIGSINIAWGAMPQWCSPAPAQPSADVIESGTVPNSNQSLPSDNGMGEVQLKVLESAPRLPAHTNPAKLRERVPVRTVPAAPSIPIPTVPAKAMSVTRLVAERALSKLAELDTTGMSPATFKNYLAKVRVAEEALATL